jgi:alkanesulfonate monooxygenase SsuD/methylene tetrahydromethanopterin reductase-like flavin-dependent oxidoreductase (luciferase family)
MRERVLAMKEIWTKDEAAFHGDFVRFDAIWSWPKPVQRPYPPVLLGGEGPRTLERVVEYCDGWFPRGRNEAAVTAGLETLRALATRAGRDPKSITVSVFGAASDAIDRYREAGITRAILRLPSENRETVLPLLDRYAKLIR